MYIKNGKPYYLPWEAFQINRYQEFLFRYKYIAVEGTYKELNPPATGFKLFYELYLKFLGDVATGIFHDYFKRGIDRFDEKKEYEWVYKRFMLWWHDVFFESCIKTAGGRFFTYIIVPVTFLANTIIYLLIMTIMNCCRRKKIKTN